MIHPQYIMTTFPDVLTGYRTFIVSRLLIVIVWLINEPDFLEISTIKHDIPSMSIIISLVRVISLVI